MREGLARGEWSGWLPSERRLCAELRVGRNSLRAALQRLAREGVVEIVPGQGSRRLGRRAGAPVRISPVVALLSPYALEEFRPRQALWVDELRRLLAEDGRQLRLLVAPRCFQPNPAPALVRLLRRERAACWVLVRSTRPIQTWFERQEVPCVVAGSCHEGVRLPCVDLDYRAMCRHAAAALLRRGHRRIAFLTPTPEAAGDFQSEAGFLEGVRRFPAEAEGRIVRHATDRESVARTVRRLMTGKGAPTALFVNQSYHYLTVFSILTSLGRRIPEDVSLICRDEDRFLAYLEPEPARYVEDPHLYGRKLARIAIGLLAGKPAHPPHVLLVPRLRWSASVARPPATAPEGLPSVARRCLGLPPP